MTERETLLVGSFLHESNTFVSGLTTRDAFRRSREQFGDDIREQLGDTNTVTGGIIDAGGAAGVELAFTVAARAEPGGPVAGEAYRFYTDRIVSAAERDDIDGVVLSLHGAMVPEGGDDGEGPLLARIRDAVGDTPVVVTLDPHSNVSEEMADRADALVVYETIPHVDMRETGRTAVGLALGAVRGEVAPTTHVERPPMLADNIRQYTGDGPMATLLSRARALEDRDGVLKTNVHTGFRRADTPSMGVSVSVVGDGDDDAARGAARELAAFAWDAREQFQSDAPGPAAAVAEATALLEEGAAATGPVVLADVGDNPGAGAPADGTAVLRELLERGVENAGFAVLRDPEAVAACLDSGVGTRVTLTLGGKSEDGYGDPIEDVTGSVAAVTDGTVRNTGPMRTGAETRFGRTVLLAVEGVRVVLTENRRQPFDTELWRHVGVQPERLDVVVVKSTLHYRAAYDSIASHVIPVDSPGQNVISVADSELFEFSEIARPKYPLDEMDDDDYPPW